MLVNKLLFAVTIEDSHVVIEASYKSLELKSVSILDTADKAE